MNSKNLLAATAAMFIGFAAYAQEGAPAAPAPGGDKMDSAATAPAPTAKKVECHGINACKGQGECGGKGHSCAGKNSCKGKGWVSTTKADCKAKHGKVSKMKKAS